jgi:hypothetical protein
MLNLIWMWGMITQSGHHRKVDSEIKGSLVKKMNNSNNLRKRGIICVEERYIFTSTL